MHKYYPKSKVELSGFMARHYDILLNLITLGKYGIDIKKVIDLMNIQPEDKIMDLGAGTGNNTCLMIKYLSRKGEIIAFDISREMIEQFQNGCAKFPNVKIINQRIEQPLPYKNIFDKVFISFVLHGFPQNIRLQIIKNAFSILKDGGEFFILDYNEFSFDNSPLFFKIPFKIIECPYAFDFITKNWKNILTDEGFKDFDEHIFFVRYVRLLKAVKS
jgi:demethylmenaquinone methyltransferase/2-methoxy-6-polyprenyl-1,4-benzoquinol methylase